jgi:transposase-like protein
MMAERGLSLAHTTILRWVQRYTPEFVKRWNRFSMPTGQSWRVDQGQPPKTITLDGYAASHRAVRELKADGLLPTDTEVRSYKYLNNLIEQDHRNIKSRTKVMLGFKRFRGAATRFKASS